MLGKKHETFDRGSQGSWCGLLPQGKDTRVNHSLALSRFYDLLIEESALADIPIHGQGCFLRNLFSMLLIDAVIDRYSHAGLLPCSK
jgi:hypothetical protein